MTSSALVMKLPVQFVGHVVEVADGDSFKVRTSRGERVAIRLHAIDAPELAQPRGREARDALKRLIAARSVRFACYKRDRVGRLICRATVHGADVELVQLNAGYAWHDTRYRSEQTRNERRRYALAEAAARHARRGLWSQGKAMPPWRCRERLRNNMGCS